MTTAVQPEVTSDVDKREDRLQVQGQAQWRAVETRDRRYAAAFVYAVSTTGIYCRPSCPSRRPKRENVEFFSAAADAVQRGFRPCRRCRPDEALAADRQLEMVRAACRYIQEWRQECQSGAPTLSQLGRMVGASPAHLQRVFKGLLGVTPRQFADAGRMDRFKAKLREGWDVTDAMYDAGYSSSSRLYEGAAGHLGMSPASYRRGGKGAQIAYTTVSCPLGQLMVAATEKGVCAVKLGSSPEELEADLRDQFPQARLYPDDSHLGRWIRAILQHLEGKQPRLELPLDIRSTAFQRLVWENLRAIPYGATRTYQQVARDLGKPGGARAVASACAANPVAVVVPCHRVVRGDGSLGGYRWGLQRKEALLKQERSRV